MRAVRGRSARLSAAGFAWYTRHIIGAAAYFYGYIRSDSRMKRRKKSKKNRTTFRFTKFGVRQDNRKEVQQCEIRKENGKESVCSG